MLTITWSKVINLQRKSDSAPNSISAGAVGSASGPPGKALADPRGVWGLHHFLKIWVSQFVQICIERDRILTKVKLVTPICLDHNISKTLEMLSEETEDCK